MLQKLTFWAVVVVAIVAAVWYRSHVLQEPEAGPTPHVAFVTGGPGEYWQATVDGAQAAADVLGVELEVRMPTEAESLEQQMQILANIDATKVNGLAISPLDADRQSTIINRLVDEMPVLTFDSDAPQSTRHGYVGTSNYAAGRMMARLVRDALPEGGKISMLLANLTKHNLGERRIGFESRLREFSEDVESDEVEVEGADAENTAADPAESSNEAGHDLYEVVSHLVDEGDDNRMAQNIRDALTEHPDLACFVGMNARHGPVLLQVLEEDGRLGRVKIVCFDTLPETLDGIEAGWISSTVAQDPFKYGYETVNMLNYLCRGETRFLPVIGHGAVHVNVEPIDKNNLSDFRQRLQAREPEVP